MDRLTLRNADGSYSQPTSSTFGKVFYKLAEYEDREEQRRKGCGYCRNEQPIHYETVMIIDEIPRGRGLFLKDMGYRYCPMCGKEQYNDKL